ncbi:FecR family protein [Wenyingzhuangia sp. 2_MG-2023]|nr:FecR family protein [Wenyingzhuangia sp. 2_MG-2023]MDO6738209.1 FecR family protein [Wenyingzhuangia sp. 2_MG-2023]
MRHKDIDKIIEKYLKGEATSEDMDVIRSLELFSENSTTGKVFDSEEVKNEIKEDIFNGIQENKNTKSLKVVRPSKNISKNVISQRFKWVKYSSVAAVLIGILGIAYMFKKNPSKFNYIIEFNNDVASTSTNKIEPGTIKATLTLQDGSLVLLEKDHVYQAKNVSSKGNDIVYKSLVESPKEIDYNYLTVPRGGQFSITLSDNTVVTLNSESQIKYPVTFIEGVTREVELIYGEAYFDVSPSTEHKGGKFRVHSASQNIEVLGTEFNISAYKGENTIHTTLVEGKVAVNFNGISKNLVPNQQSSIDLLTNNIKVKEVNVVDVTSWMNGVFTFRGSTLKEIMIVISRWYDVDIIFENKTLESIPFKGVLGKHQDLNEILETIKNLSIIKAYEIEEKIIKLK